MPRTQRLKNREVRRHGLANRLQSVLLFGFMLGFVAAAGYLIAGTSGVAASLLLGLGLFVASRRLAPQLVLRLYRVRPLDEWETPVLHRMVEQLAERAELPRVPRLCHVPSAMLNAFTVQIGRQPIIGVTDGLLRTLNRRELLGVLAHEISHIRNRDLAVMCLADVISRVTYVLSCAGQLLLLVSLPLMVVRGAPTPWVLALMLMGLPILNSLLQSALSRTREFDADLDAVRLTGDPEGLIGALMKIEWQDSGIFERIFLPGRKLPAPSLLRTHPEPLERIARIRALVETPTPEIVVQDHSDFLPARIVRIEHPPRRHWHGLWR